MPAGFAQESIQLATSDNEQQFLARAEDLLTAGNSHSAYAMLSAREAELAGNAFFDYLLGVAALDSGRASEAIFSLRRALTVAPDFSGARLELARAYFEIDSTALARPLFVQLLDEQPPAAVRTVINDYIAAIDLRPSTPKSTLRTYFDLATGYDTNANGSTSSQQFMGFTLSPNNLETDSAFAELGAGLNWSKPVSTQLAWFAAGRASLRHNPDASFVDSTLVGGSGGMNWQRGSLFGSAGLSTYWSTRDGDANENYVGLDALLGRRINDRWGMSIAVRGGALRYDDAIEILDVNRILYTAALRYDFLTAAQLRLELLGGGDSEKMSNSPYGNSKFGGRLVFYAPINSSAMLFASSGSLNSDYDGLFFGMTREDTQISTSIQIEFRDVWIAGLSLTPRIRHIDNDSNVTLYDYDRTEIGLLLRWMPQ